MRALAFASLMILVIFASAANAQKERFVGTFVAENPNTGGITRLTLFDDDTVQVWGKCRPTDCDWGTEIATTHGPNVVADLRESAQALSVMYVKSFVVSVLIIKPLKDDKLSVEVFKRFTDRSGRTAYTANYTMVREGAAP
jgi:hypothetical protein